MSVTMQEVLAVLQPDEPDYAQAAKLGSGALLHIQNIIKGSDVMLASKATYLAGLIPHQRSLAIIKDAATTHDPEVRVAAAATLRNLSTQFDCSDIFLLLVRDKDIGVRRRTLNSMKGKVAAAIYKNIQKISKEDPDPIIRSLALKALGRLSR